MATCDLCATAAGAHQPWCHHSPRYVPPAGLHDVAGALDHPDVQAWAPVPRGCYLALLRASRGGTVPMPLRTVLARLRPLCGDAEGMLAAMERGGLAICHGDDAGALAESVEMLTPSLRDASRLFQETSRGLQEVYGKS